jgi:hypothetical protein
MDGGVCRWPVCKNYKALLCSGPQHGSLVKIESDFHCGRRPVMVQTNHQKTIAQSFITMWCKAIVHRKGDEFEAAWGLQGNEFETPQKKRRLAVDDGPAVAELIPSDDEN